MLGLAKGCMESVLPYIHDRQAFGQPVADFQVRVLVHVVAVIDRGKAKEIAGKRQEQHL